MTFACINGTVATSLTPHITTMSNVAFDDALRRGDVGLVRRLIEQGEADANMMVKITDKELYPKSGGTDAVSIPALHAATAFGRVDVVQLLLEKHANVNARTRETGETALMIALERSFFQVAGVLLQGGADPNLTNRYHRSPLDRCCYASCAHFIPTLLRYGARIEGSEGARETPLHVACRTSDLQSASILVEHGADVNACNDWRRTPIFLSNNPDIMGMLLANGAKVSLQDSDMRTPLHQWARSDVACCKLLLSNNANVEARTRDGETPLQIAVDSDKFEVVCLLLAHQRVCHGRDGVASLLLKTNCLNQHVLHRAYTAKTARFLVEQCRGEDGIMLAACHQLMFAREGHGFTPLEIARMHSRSDVVQYLETFTNRTLATTNAAASDDDCVAVMLNPKLDDFQRPIATDCLDLVRTTCSEVPDAALYGMFGYLSPSDVLKR